MSGVRGRAPCCPRPLVHSGSQPGPASNWPWVRCAGLGTRLSLAPCPVPRFVVCCALFPGSWHPVAVVAWHLSWCVVVAGNMPLWRASWPRVGAPRPIQSGRSRCSSWLSCRLGAFPHPGGLRPRLYWVAARGTWRPAENRALSACRWLLPRQGCWARSGSYPVGAPNSGCPWQGPPASVLGCVRCGGLTCVNPVTDTSGFPYCPSFDKGIRLVHLGGFVWRPTPPLLGQRTPRPGPAPVCVSVPFLVASGGPASRARFGAPHLFLWPFLVRSFFARPPLGWGCLFFLFCAPQLFRRSVFSGPG